MSDRALTICEPDAPAANEVARADFQFRIAADAEPAGDVLDALAALLIEANRKQTNAQIR